MDATTSSSPSDNLLPGFETIELLDSPKGNKSFLEDDGKARRSTEGDWGWRSYKPRWLQLLNSPKWLITFLFIASLLQGMALNSFINMSIPTLERRFALNSKQTGIIVSANDITALIFVSFVSFYGGQGHKAKWLGFGIIITGISFLIFALPQFLIGPYQPSGVRTGRSPFCERNTTSVTTDPDCHEESDSSSVYYFIFILSQLLSGVGATPMHTLGTAYLDENVNPKYTSTYLAIFISSVIIGPTVGSVIGGFLLTVYIDITQPPLMKLTPLDPRWMGAWWIGPVCCGVIMIVFGALFLGFPRALPGADKMRKDAIESGIIKKEIKELRGEIKDIIPATKSLLTNGTYVFQNLAVVGSAFVWFGINPFLYKMIRGKYDAAPLEAGGVMFFALIFACGFGLWVGSFAVKKLGLRNSCSKAAKFTFFASFLGIWSSFAFIVPGCDYSQYAGVDVPYPNSTVGGELLLSQCNAGCQCSTSDYNPLCGPDGKNYFSPCYAACTGKIGSKGFTNCSCVLGNLTANHSSALFTNGQCSRTCRNLYTFVGVICFVVMLGLSNTIPSKIVSLRSVPDNQRSYGLGLQFFFKRLIGGIPGPIIVGYMIDETCTMWKTKCDEKANCLNYDYDRLGWILVYYGMPFQGLSLIFYFLSWHFSKRSDTDPVIATGEERTALANGEPNSTGPDPLKAS